MDGILAQAIAGEAFASLPGNGQTPRLRRLFRQRPENRVASKLLKDNDVLPPSLQNHRDSEQLHEQAQQELQHQSTPLDLKSCSNQPKR
ncbi:MAG TPA: DUF1992 domain-containing protein [Candidatus Handelsmanbacteria bacterium]|nr:DUF1992 domain-containing protein [Candidatus Handelsmanbacteria bacterium]